MDNLVVSDSYVIAQNGDNYQLVSGTGLTVLALVNHNIHSEAVFSLDAERV